MAVDAFPEESQAITRSNLLSPEAIETVKVFEVDVRTAVAVVSQVMVLTESRAYRNLAKSDAVTLMLASKVVVKEVSAVTVGAGGAVVSGVGVGIGVGVGVGVGVEVPVPLPDVILNVALMAGDEAKV